MDSACALVFRGSRTNWVLIQKDTHTFYLNTAMVPWGQYQQCLARVRGWSFMVPEPSTPPGRDFWWAEAWCHPDIKKRGVFRRKGIAVKLTVLYMAHRKMAVKLRFLLAWCTSNLGGFWIYERMVPEMDQQGTRDQDDKTKILQPTQKRLKETQIREQLKRERIGLRKKTGKTYGKLKEQLKRNSWNK